jgi:hypothetical protein
VHKVNDEICHYIFLVNVVVDTLAILIVWEKEDGQVGGLIPQLVDGGVSSYNMQMIPSFLWSMALKRR